MGAWYGSQVNEWAMGRTMIYLGLRIDLAVWVSVACNTPVTSQAKSCLTGTWLEGEVPDLLYWQHKSVGAREDRQDWLCSDVEDLYCWPECRRLHGSRHCKHHLLWTQDTALSSLKDGIQDRSKPFPCNGIKMRSQHRCPLHAFHHAI